MLTLLTQSISNTSFGIFFPKFNGTIYVILAAPISTFETVLAFVGAGATKTLIVGVVIFVTSTFFVEVYVEKPFPKKIRAWGAIFFSDQGPWAPQKIMGPGPPRIIRGPWAPSLSGALPPR